MADHFYGVNLGHGADPSALTVGTSTGGTNFELRIRDGVTGMTKTDVVKALETIENYIVTNSAPA